jgi:hypothetical protein
MSVLTKEVTHIQNPALGAVLLWRFAVGYTAAHRTSESPPVQLGFIVLPIILHQETCDVLRSTNLPSGLHGFAQKFSSAEVGKADLLFSIHARSIAFRNLSLDSLRFCVRHRLLTVTPSDGRLIPLSQTNPTGVAHSTRPLLSASEKLGKWLSALSLFEITTVLKVVL